MAHFIERPTLFIPLLWSRLLLLPKRQLILGAVWRRIPPTARLPYRALVRQQAIKTKELAEKSEYPSFPSAYRFVSFTRLWSPSKRSRDLSFLTNAWSYRHGKVTLRRAQKARLFPLG